MQYPYAQRSRLASLHRSREADDPVRVEAQHEFDIMVALYRLEKDITSRKLTAEDRELLINAIKEAS